MVWEVLQFTAARSLYNQIIDTEPALILDAEGIRNNTSYIHRGLIKWSDIDHISHSETGGARFIYLHVGETTDHPESPANTQIIALATASLIDEGRINVQTPSKSPNAIAELTRKDIVNIDTQSLSADFDTLRANLYLSPNTKDKIDHRNLTSAGQHVRT